MIPRVSALRPFIFPLLFILSVVWPGTVDAQRWLTLRLTDGITHYPLAGVGITTLPDSIKAYTSADGIALLRMTKNSRSVKVDYDGFQSVRISAIHSGTDDLDATLSLFPVEEMPHGFQSDSISRSDSLSTCTWDELRQKALRARSFLLSRADIIERPLLQPGTDQTLASVLAKMNGVVGLNDPGDLSSCQLMMSGISPRYNDLQQDQVSLPSSGLMKRSYDSGKWPVEMLETVALIRDGQTTLSGDFSVSAVLFTTRDAPVRNFFSVRIGGTLISNTTRKYFASDQKFFVENLGFLSEAHRLDGHFPTSRSQTSLSAKNIQEQTYQERALPNSLAPASVASASPGENILIGFGRNFFLKKNLRISCVAFLQQESNLLTSDVKTQVFPDLAAISSRNSSLPVIRSQSVNQQFQRVNSTAAFFNSNIYFGRNKVTVKADFSSQINDDFISRSEVYKPDEDTLAHAGIIYRIRQRQSLQTQLSGEHGLGISSRFKLHWFAAYRHSREQQPDGRNLLLRQQGNGSDLFQLAQPASNTGVSDDLPLTFSSRDWRSASDDAFAAQADIGIPFHLFRMPGRVSGGIVLQTTNRELHDDLYLIEGTAIGSLRNLFSAQNYYPGHLALSNYYKNPDNVNSLVAENRGNYTASRNVTAAFIAAEGRNKLLRLTAGLRMESSSQLGSATEYSYFTGFKFPRIIPLDQNTEPLQLLVLPSFSLIVPLALHFDLGGSYLRSVHRPELQELVNYREYDPLTFSVKSGNSLLQNTLVDNYRVSVGWKGKEDNRATLSGFYKSFTDAVENVVSGFGNSRGIVLFTPFNMPSAYVKGLSFSFRYRLVEAPAGTLLSYLSVFGEADWLSSSVSGGPLKSLSTPTAAAHPMTETPKQVYTGGVWLQHPRFPMLSLSFNHFADYLSAVGSGQWYPVAAGTQVQAMPGYHIKGRTNLDLQLSQLLFKRRCQVSAGVKNLLRPDFAEYQDLNGNSKLDAALQLSNGAGSGGYYRVGTDNTVRSVKTQSTFILSISYLFDKR